MTQAEARARWMRQACAWPFDEGRWKRLGAAVSGGGDSMALLDLMAWHGAQRGLEIHAVTVDHGLRAEAADEAALVAEFCGARGIGHDVLRWDWDGHGNLQAAAREARYGLIAGWARKARVNVVALGHTRDDVAETFLLRLARSAGVDGLAAMERRFSRNGIAWVRPILRFGRDDARAYLSDRGIGWAEDASNADERFDRVKARNILAALEPLDIDADRLSRTAQHLASAKWALDWYAGQEAERLVRQDRGDLILARDALPPVPPEIERRLLVAGLQWVSGAAYPPRVSALAAMEAAFIDADTHTLGGCVVGLTRPKGAARHELRITREWNAVKDGDCPTRQVWDGRWRLDGPHARDLRVRALGEDGLKQCPDWRGTGLPRVSLLASPSVWRGEALISAPIAGLSGGWTARLAPGRDDFAKSLLSR